MMRLDEDVDFIFNGTKAQMSSYNKLVINKLLLILLHTTVVVHVFAFFHNTKQREHENTKKSAQKEKCVIIGLKGV